MKATLKFFNKLKSNIFHSIAFYPVLISTLFVLFAIILLSVENSEIITDFKETVPYFIVKEHDTANTILSTIFGGILSLTVFSFTMVMVVLNQASSNFSPRLLPGLVSDKKHQIILGFYIGTLLYSIIVLMSLATYASSSNVIGFSVMMSAAFGVTCVGLFVYFIHSISQAIQIHNIINQIYYSSKRLLDEEKKEQEEASNAFSTVSGDYTIIKSDRTGYYHSFDGTLLPDTFKERSTTIEILPYPDQHIWKGTPILKVKGRLSEEDEEALCLCLYILSNQHEDDSSTGGMIKLSEVAVKALSPGINDPGTAINSISKLGQLLHSALQIEATTQIDIPESEIKSIHNKITPDEMLRIIVQPIRQYGKGDASVAHSLMRTLIYIHKSEEVLSEYQWAIQAEIDCLVYDVKQAISNREDVKTILNLLE
jgi:uncharacterized membrane protein